MAVIGPISDISRAFSESHDFLDLDVSKPIWEFESGLWNVQISESNFLIDVNRWRLDFLAAPLSAYKKARRA